MRLLKRFLALLLSHTATGAIIAGLAVSLLLGREYLYSAFADLQDGFEV